ncbi:hypothetical protein [Aeromicrobium sp.]|uniref:hypothetical protein n=1 Tax=Aeromicrobium sp. TaxID=1871063 RepID=UPI003C38BD0E
MKRFPRQLSIKWMRRHKLESAASVAIALGAAAILVATILNLSSGTEKSAAAGVVSLGGPASPQQTGLESAESAGGGLRLLTSESQQGLGALEGPGLGGEGGVKNLPSHRLTLSVTSNAPIGTVGYLVPTSTDKSHGVVRDVDTSWSLSTTVYGRPDYGQIFTQAGAQGVRITCTITVDGKLTDQRSAQGTYSQGFCQG